ncbi:hypothetical protein TcasGA2_TC000429 [Tribolium castaneum]|uniref:Uncharacterized protein n=1 Tax=Tribolium castaneum TaxID=7070 RepID=D6WAC5_TRICA|nr:hypothetical protein TcasGA2_TC000429 [Tribolium castaneum]
MRGVWPAPSYISKYSLGARGQAAEERACIDRQMKVPTCLLPPRWPVTVPPWMLCRQRWHRDSLFTVAVDASRHQRLSKPVYHMLMIDD